MARTGQEKELPHERAALAVVLTGVAGAVDALSITALGRRGRRGRLAVRAMG